MVVPIPSPDEPSGIESLVLHCLDATDPLAELARRTVGDPATYAAARKLLEQTQRLEAGAAATVPSVAPVPKAAATAEGDKVQSTATGDLIEKLAQAPKLDEERFTVQREIGKGGMGLVLQIEDRYLNRRLAMKVLLERPDSTSGNASRLASQMLGRFLEEAQVTSQLDHPGVVPVHELGLDQRGKVYFTMRLVRGRTAGEVFADARAERNDWTVTRALEVILKVCDTMSYAHDKGVLHRDLKPANVMVGRFGEVYVMDWGLAKVLGQADRHDLRIVDDPKPAVTRLETVRRQDAATDDGSSIVTIDGQQLGTPSYMSLQQARGEDLDQRADVYSIGAMLYELLRGLPPYCIPGVRPVAYHLLREIVSGPPDALHKVAPDVPAELVAIVEKAMARDVAERYPTTAALAADLRAFLGQRVVRAYRTGALVELRLWVRRNTPLAASLAAAVLALLAGVGVTTWLAEKNAALASVANREKDRAVIAMRTADATAATNARLAAAELEAKQQAQASERLAQQRAAENERLAAAEAAAKAVAQQTVDQFQQLAGVVRLKNALAAQEALWPAYPDQIPALEGWLRDACDPLLALRPRLQATVAELRTKALPPTPAEAAADRRAAREFAAWDRQRQLVGALQRVAAIRAGTQPFAVPELPATLREASATALNDHAWQRVAPEAPGSPPARRLFGEEAEALAAARAAIAAGAGPPLAADRLVTLAWAALANGQDAEATQRAAEAVAQASSSERARLVEQQRELQAAIAEAPARLAAAEARLAELDAKVSVRRTWTFAGDEDGAAARFLHDALVELLAGLDVLATRQRASVAQRLLWARQVGAATAAHPQARVTWAQARAAIAKADGVVASTRYAGKDLVVPDDGWTGLVPIGMNPVTKLWEFYDLRSAWDGKQAIVDIRIPAHAADGRIEVGDATGIVFVLLPGGEFMMGSQRTDPAAPNYDVDSGNREEPHRVALAPYLLARHEVTQAQWARMWDGDEALRTPSSHRAGIRFHGRTITAAHPVEQVDWTMADGTLRRHGMALPTEAQWEWGARSGTTTPWCVPYDELRRHANLASSDVVAIGATWGHEPWSDDHAVHAPVGSYLPNAFGLFDVHGNLWEWCRDRDGKSGTARAGDGLMRAAATSDRGFRGGSYNTLAVTARSANRDGLGPTVRDPGIGLRAARNLAR